MFVLKKKFAIEFLHFFLLLKRKKKIAITPSSKKEYIKWFNDQMCNVLREAYKPITHRLSEHHKKHECVFNFMVRKCVVFLEIENIR